MSEIRTIIDALIERKVPDEALGVWRPEKKIFGVPRPAAIDPAGRAWRLGALLIDRDGTLYATGKLTRAIVPKDFNADKSLAGEAHRDIQRARRARLFSRGRVGQLRVDSPRTRRSPASAVSGRRRAAGHRRRDSAA